MAPAIALLPSRFGSSLLLMVPPRPGKWSSASKGDRSSIPVIPMEPGNMPVTITRNTSINGSRRLVDGDSTRAPELVHDFNPAFLRPAANGPTIPNEVALSKLVWGIAMLVRLCKEGERFDIYMEKTQIGRAHV